MLKANPSLREVAGSDISIQNTMLAAIRSNKLKPDVERRGVKIRTRIVPQMLVHTIKKLRSACAVAPTDELLDNHDQVIQLLVSLFERLFRANLCISQSSHPLIRVRLCGDQSIKAFIEAHGQRS